MGYTSGIICMHHACDIQLEAYGMTGVLSRKRSYFIEIGGVILEALCQKVWINWIVMLVYSASC